MAPLLSIWFDGFFDGFTGAGLFGPLSRPGAPTEFLDSRSVEEFESSGEFDIIANRFTIAGAPCPHSETSHRLPLR